MNPPIFWICLRKHDGVDLAALVARAGVAEAFWKLDEGFPVRDATVSANIATVVWSTGGATRNVLPFSRVEADRSYFAMHLPYAAGLSHHAHGKDPSGWLADCFRQMSGSPIGAAGLSPPFSMGCHYKNNDRLVLFNDHLGLSKIYFHEDENCVAFSSRISAIALINQVRLDLDAQAWAGYATFDHFLGDRTPFQGISIAGPGTRIDIDGASRKADVVSWHPLSNWLERRDELTSSQIQDAAHSLVATVTDAQTYNRGAPMNMGLSGGRDSRAVVSAVFASGLDFTCVTASPPRLEVTIASQLIEALPRAVKWKEHKRPQAVANASDTGVGSTRGSLVQQGDYWFWWFDGDTWSSWVVDPPGGPGLYRPRLDALTLDGCGGEAIKSNHYREAQLQQQNEYLDIRCNFLQRYVELVRDESKRQAIDTFRSVALEGVSAGFDGLYTIDWFAVFGQMRRQLPLAQRINDAHPLMTFDVVRYGFGLPIRDKLNGTFLNNLTTSNVPEWKGIPYFDEIQHLYPIDEYDNVVVLGYSWEGNTKDEFMDIINEHYSVIFDHEGAKTVYETVRRGDPLCALYQHIGNRIIWESSARRYCKKINELSK